MTSPRLALVVSLAVLLLPSMAPAQTTEPTTFPELVKSAQRIFVGEVVAVDSFRADNAGGLRIRTRVTFNVDDALRGSGRIAILEFLGGTVGDLTQEIADQPLFAKGERYVVFARDGDRWVNPIVGSTDGLLRISRDVRDGTARVLTAAHAPLPNVMAIGQGVTRVSPTMSMPMSLAGFISDIRAEMTRQSR